METKVTIKAQRRMRARSGSGVWLVTNLLSFCFCDERVFSLTVSEARGGMQGVKHLICIIVNRMYANKNNLHG